MRELTPETITDAVLDQMATTPDPRLKTIMASAVKHLHAFAREVVERGGEHSPVIDLPQFPFERATIAPHS